MKVKLLIAAVALAAITSSCASFKYYHNEGRWAQADSDVVVIPPTARVNVQGERIFDTWVFEGDDLKPYLSTSVATTRDKLKVAATQKSLESHGGDVLIAPLFSVKSDLNGQRYVVTVRGYIGSYTDWDKNAVSVDRVKVGTLK